jgi:nucleoside permease NupC
MTMFCKYDIASYSTGSFLVWKPCTGSSTELNRFCHYFNLAELLFNCTNHKMAISKFNLCLFSQFTTIKVVPLGTKAIANLTTNADQDIS